MTLTTIGEIAALGGLVALAGFEVYRYEEIHLPDFEMVKAEVFFERCLRECQEICAKTCAANGIPSDECECDCSHCRKYIEGD